MRKIRKDKRYARQRPIPVKIVAEKWDCWLDVNFLSDMNKNLKEIKTVSLFIGKAKTYLNWILKLLLRGIYRGLIFWWDSEENVS